MPKSSTEHLSQVAARIVDSTFGDVLASRSSLEIQISRTIFSGFETWTRLGCEGDYVAAIAAKLGMDVCEVERRLKVGTEHHEETVRRFDEYKAWRESRPKAVAYFVQSGAFVKIGASKRVADRVAQIQQHAAETHRLLGTLPGGMKTERDCHARFAHLRSHREWFHATAEIMAAIDEALATTPGAERSDYAWSPPALASA